MIMKFDAGKYRVLAIAVFLSLAAHIFWLSVLKVDTYDPDRAQVRFSKVSFLGPILGIGGLELNIAPRSGSFLEKRYIDNLKAEVRQARPVTPDESSMHEPETFFGASVEKALISNISGILAEAKPQPSRSE